MNIVLKNSMLFLPTLAICCIFFAKVVEASDDTYLGCYDENGWDAVFLRDSLTNITDLNSLAPDGCRERCRKDLIYFYSFAGLWGGTLCLCAQTAWYINNGLSKVNDSLCYSPCPGKSTEFCGGSNESYIFSVYSVCSRGLYGRYCTSKCNCKDSASCTINGVCPGLECAAGWILNTTIANQERCDIDIDECKEGSSNCNQNCHNTVGNYSCSCNTGYELGDDHHKCNDIDECSNNILSNCSQKCRNNPGSYECECNTGFELHSDKHQCADIDECYRETSKCNQNCSNTYGWYNCSCYTSGYRLENEFNCVDVDECADNKGRCEYYCNNTIGSFVCSCRPGYRIAVKIGEKYNCTDIDECVEGSSGCEHKCNNTIGGYNCSCHSGFTLDSDLKTCNDVDECESKTTHKCLQNCHNQVGKYSCSCDDGFYSDGPFDCRKDSSSIISGLGIIIGIQFIIIIIQLLIMLKWKRAEKAKEEEIALDVYATLDKKARSGHAEDQPESVYTAIIPPDQTPDENHDIYANSKTN